MALQARVDEGTGASFKNAVAFIATEPKAHYMWFKVKLQILDSLRIGLSHQVSAKNLSGYLTMLAYPDHEVYLSC